MSIMIKDMEMPDSCYDCRMRTDSDFCSAMPKEFCGYTDDIKRPDWCPLIELPSAEPETKEIGYVECSSALLKMWMDGVLTDREYDRITDKLNNYKWASGGVR